VNDEVRYRLHDGRDLFLPVFLGAWVCVPHGLLAHEPALVWCADCRLADVLGPQIREEIALIEIDGERIDPDAGVFLVALGDWQRRFGGREQQGAGTRSGSPRGLAAGAIPLAPLAGWTPATAIPRRRGAGAPARALGRAHAALELARVADVHLAAGWIAQALLGGLNLIVLWATLGWARAAWGSTSGGDVLNGVFLALLALLVGGVAQRLRHGKRAHLAPATLADACGVICMAVVSVVLVLAFLGLS
jgi:hypothetical protein